MESIIYIIFQSLIIPISLIIFGIILLITSREIKSCSLKFAILFPFLVYLTFLLFLIALFITKNNDIIMLPLIYGTIPSFILSIISIILSIKVLKKSENKFVSIGSLIYSISLFLLSLMLINAYVFILRTGPLVF